MEMWVKCVCLRGGAVGSSRFVKANGERLFLRLRIESNGFNVAIRMSSGLYRHMMKSQPTTKRSKALEAASVAFCLFISFFTFQLFAAAQGSFRSN
jgi:hypothetical protein